MAIEHRMVHFRTDDVSDVVAEVEAIAERGTGLEWVTIAPWVDPEDLPVVSLLRRMFSARASRVPEVTWVPAHGKEAAQLGVLHATGPGALQRLHDDGIVPPDRWHKIGDHSKRGLLFAVPPDSDAGDLIGFALDAATALAGVPTDDRWVAQISSSHR